MVESAEHSEELFEILNKYLEDLEQGCAPAEDEFLAAHPELRERLESCLRSLDFFKESGSDQVDLVGKTLGDYEIRRELGRGGMGVVYEAHQVSLGRPVALKTLPAAATLNDKQLRRFKNEAVAAARLQHANIVPVHAVGAHDGVYYYAMRLIPGTTLADGIEALRRDEVLPPMAAMLGAEPSTESRSYFRACARVAIQVALALGHAHKNHIIHRDIKPANLIIDDDGQVWITDFGLAALMHQNTTLTMSGDLVGTARYMSPEQWRPGKRPVDHRTDVYSLGVTLFELISLEQPFPGEGIHELMESVLSEDSLDVARHNRACPRALALIVKKATANSPDDRYECAEALAADLERFLDDRPVHARPPTFGERVRALARRNKRWVAAAVPVLLAAIISAVVIANRDEDAARQKERADRTPVLTQEANRLLWEARSRMAGLEEEQALASYSESLPHLEQLVAWHPENVMHRWHISHVQLQVVGALRNLGRCEDALAHAEGAIEHRSWIRKNHPERSDMRVHLARAHGMKGSCQWVLGKPEQARESFHRCVALLEEQAAEDEQPDVIWAYLPIHYFRLGLLLRDMGRPEEAADAFRSALRERMDYVYEQQWQAWVLAMCPDLAFRAPKRAVELATRARSGPARDATRSFIYGAACYRAGAFDEAITALHQAIELRGGGNGLHWYLLAMAHWKRGDKTEARTWFGKSEEERDTTCLLPDFSRFELARLKSEAAELLRE